MALTRPRLGQLNTNVVAQADPITVLNQGASSANVDVGFLFNRANGLVSNVALYWSESAQSIVTAYTSSTGTTNSNISVTSYADLTVGNVLTVNGSIIGIVGNLTLGNLIANTGVYAVSSVVSGNVSAGNVLASGFFYANGSPFVSSSYGNATVALYLPTYSGSIGAATEIVTLTANAGAQSNQITGANVAIARIDANLGSFQTYANLTFSTTINPAIYFGEVTASTAPTLIDTVPVTGNSLVRWTTTSYDSVYNQYRSGIIDSVNNGTEVYYTDYGVIVSNVGTTVVTFTSNITSGNINLWATGNTASVAVTYQRVVLGSGTTSGYLTTGPAGATGAMSWTITSSNITVSKNNGYFVDTTTGPKTLTLPASNTIGDTVRINDLAGTFASNNLTVGANGGKIQGVADDLKVSVNQKSFGLVYSNSTYGWKLLEL